MRIISRLNLKMGDEGFVNEYKDSDASFSRDRTFTFKVLICFLMTNLQKGLQREISLFKDAIEFDGGSIPEVSKSAFSQARSKLKPTVFVALSNIVEFYDAKQYLQSAQAFSHAFESMGWKGLADDRYNAACSWSRAGNKDSAFFQLNRIVTKGNFTNYNRINSDEDLGSLHSDSRWASLLELIKQNKEKAEANLNKALVALLDTVYRNDQGGRMKLDKVEKKYGQNSKKVKDLWKSISEKDSIDLIKVEHILDQYGWAGPDVVGNEGNTTIFLVIQHSDIKVQEKYLPMMREAVKNKKAQPSELALLEDRVALGEGKKQVYGSQIRSDTNGNRWISPLDDPDNVDKRRAEVGLPPLADYVSHWNIKWDVEEYKKQLPEIEKKEKH